MDKLKVSKKGPVPGLRPLQNGISSHRDRLKIQKFEQEKRNRISY